MKTALEIHKRIVGLNKEKDIVFAQITRRGDEFGFLVNRMAIIDSEVAMLEWVIEEEAPF